MFITDEIFNAMVLKANKYGSYYVHDEVIIFSNCGDIILHENIFFPDAKVVIFDNCDKNFTYYMWVPYRFRVASLFIINGHPAEYRTQYRFPAHEVVVPLAYQKYWSDRLNVRFLGPEAMRYLIFKYEYSWISIYLLFIFFLITIFFFF